MNLFDIWLNVIKNHYADFSGRVGKREFWSYTAVSVLLGFIVNALNYVMPHSMSWIVSILALAVGLGLLVPNLAMGVRRLQDIGKEWTFILFGLIPCVGIIILIYFWIQDSQLGPNQFGPMPEDGPGPRPMYGAQQQGWQQPQQQAYGQQQPNYQQPQQNWQQPQQPDFGQQQPNYQQPQQNWQQPQQPEFGQQQPNDQHPQQNWQQPQQPAYGQQQQGYPQQPQQGWPQQETPQQAPPRQPQQGWPQHSDPGTPPPPPSGWPQQ